MNDTWPSFLMSRGARLNASGHPQFDAALEPNQASVTPLLCEASILVRGHDAASFLQGQLSNDIQRVARTQGQLAAYCTPKGRVLATFTVWPHEEGYVLRVPVELAEPIRKRLQMYVLRSRVELSEISDRVALLGVVNPQSVPALTEHFSSSLRPYAVSSFEAQLAMALPGRRVEIAVQIGIAERLWDAVVSAGCTPAGQEVWDYHAIGAGVPTILAPTSDQFIPQILNLELIHAVAFDKGCYPGQEIVARTQYRGQVKRRLYRFAADVTSHAGAEVLNDQGAVAGMVVNAAPDLRGHFELLAVTSVHAEDEAFRLRDGSVLRPLPLPYELPQVHSVTDGN